MASVLGAKWQSMSDAEKKKYEDQNKKGQEKYEKEMKSYNDKNKDKLE